MKITVNKHTATFATILFEEGRTLFSPGGIDPEEGRKLAEELRRAASELLDALPVEEVVTHA